MINNIRLGVNIDHVATLRNARGGNHPQISKAAIIAENAGADKALRLLLAEHSQLSIAVDEFGSVAGVLAMEDIMESILGQEIFEHDDLAVDMRELAKRRHDAKSNLEIKPNN